MSLSQQTGVPSPGLVQRISVPQTSHRYRLPSCAIKCGSPSFGAKICEFKLFLDFHGLPAAVQRSFAAAGDNKLRPALFADISFANFVCHMI
jgi:hypothetical protein